MSICGDQFSSATRGHRLEYYGAPQKNKGPPCGDASKKRAGESMLQRRTPPPSASWTIPGAAVLGTVGWSSIPGPHPLGARNPPVGQPQVSPTLLSIPWDRTTPVKNHCCRLSK